MKTTTAFICFLLINCTIQQKSETVIIDFLNGIILTEKFVDSDLREYLNFDKRNKDLIMFNVKFLNQQIKNKKNIEIISYEEFLKKEVFKDFKIRYEGTGRIYCILYEKKFLTSVIINNNGKIDSFFTGIIKNTNKIHPIILNDIIN